ncbi:MAG TPA: NAD(P)/FAD-dependent oxidoreductase [Bacillota bacterium]|nr:NAD(P)/FAD-dependent oxidoreductase [Bacillota bacterium]
MKKTDCAIVGRGPAGLSAAIYVARSGLNVTVVGRDIGALSGSDLIENYFGFEEPLSGQDLVARGTAQANRLGVEILTAEVTGASMIDSGFQLNTSEGSIECISLILATGLPRKKPSIEGVKEYEGAGLSYCAICDGFFYRGKEVAVLGNGNYALQEAHELLAYASSVTILTNGRELSADLEADKRIEINTEPIRRIEGVDDYVSGIRFNSGEFLPVKGIFIAEGTASALDLANSLGVVTDKDAIEITKDGATNLPGVFAAGDCTGALAQVAVAAGEGAIAGLAAARHIKRAKVEARS